MNSTLLVGSYDWDPQRMPREEFQARMRALWQRLPAECAGVAVYGDRRANAELVYFSHLVPKLRDAVLLLARNAEPRLLVAGGANAMPPAARQTWVEKLEPLNDLGKAVSQWKSDLKGQVAVIGADAVRMAVHRGVVEAADESLSRKASEAVHAQMAVKSPRELAELKRACAMLSALTAALQGAQAAGKHVTDCIAAAEHEVVRMDAGEVRSLFSLDGGRTLRPFVSPVARRVDPLQAYFAVRAGGYWVEGFTQATQAPVAATKQARVALDVLLGMLKPGSTCKELSDRLIREVAPLKTHPLTGGRPVQPLGLALSSEPESGDVEAVQPGGVYSIRVGLTDGKERHAIVSAVVAINENGSELLWTDSLTGVSQ